MFFMKSHYLETYILFCILEIILPSDKLYYSNKQPQDLSCLQKWRFISHLGVFCRLTEALLHVPFTLGSMLKEQFISGTLKFSFQKEKSDVLFLDHKSSKKQHTSIPLMLHWSKQVLSLSQKTMGWRCIIFPQGGTVCWTKDTNLDLTKILILAI